MCAFVFYAHKSRKVVLFYHGAAPEVPQERVIVVFNPFRTRESENTAERLMHDLRTGDCQCIVQGLTRGMDYDPRICVVMHAAGRHSLVWREDGVESRVLVYDIPEKEARLWITFQRHESGFGVAYVSVVR